MPLSSLILTIDTREKDQKRINAITTFFEKHGAIVERGKLDLCDYHIEGDFRDTEINLGIEGKKLGVDFDSSYQELPHKLMKSYDLYKDVALFVQTGSYGFNVGDDGLLCIIKNPTVHDGKADILTLPSFENSLGSWANDGIIVRQLQHEAQWPYTMYNVLINLAKPIHSGIQLKQSDSYSVSLNMLVKMPGIGIETAKKLLESFGNFHWIACSSYDDILDCVGKSKADIVYNTLNDFEMVRKSQRIKIK